MDDNWTEIGGGTLVRWDAPRAITGTYQGFVEVPGYGGKGTQKKHTILSDEDEVLNFFAPAILQRQLDDPRVQPGVRIQVEYTGNTVTTKGGQTAKEFIVRLAKPD